LKEKRLLIIKYKLERVIDNGVLRHLEEVHGHVIALPTPRLCLRQHLLEFYIEYTPESTNNNNNRQPFGAHIFLSKLGFNQSESLKKNIVHSCQANS
jgi:hypothetical protein